MKITIFTISDCYFSKQEKEYLQSHNLPFDERNLEENREFLTEMLTISNNFAGTPVTKIEKDDGQIVVLKGFTKEEFDKTFNITDAPVAAVAEMSPPKITLSEPVVGPTVPTPAPEPAPQPPAPMPAEPVSAPTPPTTPPNVDLGSIAAQIEQLKKLQESLAAQQSAPAPTPVAAPVVAPPMPEPVAQPVASVPPTQAAPQAPAVQPANVDDSLAAILAELQTKINSSQDSGTPGTPPAAN
ncbi:glutaredoxin family protein [Candidatus Woesebacteria bacterium]|nr:glutaredoxin family protein [Candidatus Woesebacteria bacterium]